MGQPIVPYALVILVTATASIVACGSDETSSSTSSASTATTSSTSTVGSGGNGATGAGGMTSSTSSSTGTGGQGGGVPECTVPADCPDPGSVCFERTCIDQTCGKVVNYGLEVTSLAEGDCKHRVCDANGNIVPVADPTDTYDDGNGCTANTCSGDTPENNPFPQGYLCATGLCGTTPLGGPACVQCLVSAHCAGNPATPLCQAGKCVAASCGNGIKDANEPTTDCGKDCALCPDNAVCNNLLDCINGICSGTPKICQPASCMDFVANGFETDIDCGGPDCAKCIATQKCVFPADCESNVCLMNTCQAASCSDGVMNQDETDIDCGGMTCNTCP